MVVRLQEARLGGPRVLEPGPRILSRADVEVRADRDYARIRRRMFRRRVIEIYADLGTEYVLPPEFITLLYRYPEMLPTLRWICKSLERE